MEQNPMIDPEIWAQIQEQFEKFKLDSGVGEEEGDENYNDFLEELMGMSVEEMNTETEIAIKSRVLGIKLINNDVKMPSYAYPSDSGFDLCSTIEKTIPPLGRALIPTGVQLSIPDDCEIQVRPKSGLALNSGLTVLNTPGTVDSGYNGEIKVIVFNTTNQEFYVTKGMKIAQAVLCPVFTGKYVRLEQLDNIENKDRNDNGFGSTGI